MSKRVMIGSDDFAGLPRFQGANRSAIERAITDLKSRELL